MSARWCALLGIASVAMLAVNAVQGNLPATGGWLAATSAYFLLWLDAK